MFNPDQFLDMQVTDPNDTKTIPVPVGEYTAVIEEVKCRQWQSKKDLSVSGLTLDILWSVDDSAVKELLGRDKVTVKQGIMLDLTDAGGLDMGKGRNIGLGRLREALGLNTPGQPFSFSMIAGRVAKVSVSHRIDGENIYAEVKGVAKLG
jgi:hypothetical protein